MDNTQTTIAEDDPNWDCATMGNLICGPGSTSPTMGYHEVMTSYASMPDTAMQPEGLDLTGLIVVLILIVTWVHQSVFSPRR